MTTTDYLTDAEKLMAIRVIIDDTWERYAPVEATADVLRDGLDRIAKVLDIARPTRVTHKDRVLEVIRSAYPKPLRLHDICHRAQAGAKRTRSVLEECQRERLVEVHGDRWRAIPPSKIGP